MAIQIQGQSGTVVEVETNTRSKRITQRPVDVGAQGSYSVAVASGTEAAGMTGASPVWNFRWAPTSTGLLALVRRITFQAAVLDTGFTAGTCLFNFFVARGFTVDDTGGGAATLTTNNGKLRTSFGTTAATIRKTTTGVLTAGTRTKDANPFRTILSSIGTGTYTSLVAATEVFRAAPGEWPLVLAVNEGLVLECTVPATGTWNWMVGIDWDEVSSYGAATLT